MFLGWLKGEPDKKPVCQVLLREAETGTLTIVTSSVTIIEVIKLRNKPQLDPAHWPTLRAFFRQPYISIRTLDFRVSEAARELIWNENLSQQDSVHMATALRWGLSRMDTFDAGLIALSEKYGTPPLVVGQPTMPPQGVLDVGGA